MRVGVLLSGRGSNLQALLDAGAASWKVALAVSNVPGAPGLTIRKNRSLSISYSNWRSRPSKVRTSR